MKNKKYMAIINIKGTESTFTYTAKNKKEGLKELNKFFCRDTDPIAKKNIKITLVEIGFDGNYYFNKKTGRKF